VLEHVYRLHTLMLILSYFFYQVRFCLARASTLVFLFSAVCSAIPGPCASVPSFASQPSELASTALVCHTVSIVSLCLPVQKACCLIHSACWWDRLPPPPPLFTTQHSKPASIPVPPPTTLTQAMTKTTQYLLF
jgi:hypothetical protein